MDVYEAVHLVNGGQTDFGFHSQSRDMLARLTPLIRSDSPLSEGPELSGHLLWVEPGSLLVALFGLESQEAYGASNVCWGKWITPTNVHRFQCFRIKDYGLKMSFGLNKAWLKRTFKGVIDLNLVEEGKEAEEYALLTG